MVVIPGGQGGGLMVSGGMAYTVIWRDGDGTGGGDVVLAVTVTVAI
jgi:hypothetical protein